MKQVIGGINVSSILSLSTRKAVWKNVAESLKVYADELERAADFETALKNLVEGMKGTMADWVIVSITETPLMDVYPFDPERKTKEEDRPQE